MIQVQEQHSCFPEFAGELSKLSPTTIALSRAEGNLCYKMGKAIELWYLGNSDKFIPPSHQHLKRSVPVLLQHLDLSISVVKH